MNILFLGCSHTGGTFRQTRYPDITYTYVHALAEKYPEHNFYNLGYQGTSIYYSLFLYEYIKQGLTDIKFDKVSFQITSPDRLTVFPKLSNQKLFEKIFSNLSKYLHQEGSNYYYLHHNTFPIISMIKNFQGTDDFTNLSHLYYEYIDSFFFFDLEYKIQLHYIKKNFDIYWSIRHINPKYDINVLSVEESLSSDKYDKFCAPCKHFLPDGAKYVANWVVDNFRVV